MKKKRHFDKWVYLGPKVRQLEKSIFIQISKINKTKILPHDSKNIFSCKE